MVLELEETAFAEENVVGSGFILPKSRQEHVVITEIRERDLSHRWDETWFANSSYAVRNRWKLLSVAPFAVG